MDTRKEKKVDLARGRWEGACNVELLTLRTGSACAPRGGASSAACFHPIPLFPAEGQTHIQTSAERKRN